MRTALAAVLLLSTAAVAQKAVPMWHVHEIAFEASDEYADPLRQVALTVTFTSPGGTKTTRPAFWDGGRSFKVRFAPGQAGTWTYDTTCQPADPSLHGHTGSFDVAASKEKLAICQHGPLQVSANGKYLQHADGTPFFYLADTAWNGVSHATDAQWQAYIDNRLARGFTAVQFVVTPWRGSPGNRAGQVAYTGNEKIAINPEFFANVDRKIGMLNRAGLLAAPVLLWALGKSPGVDLPEDQAILLARYQLARYGAHHAILLLNGDGNYLGPNAEKWKRIGRAVFADEKPRPTAIHCGGQTFPHDQFAGEKWLDIVGYQSGHGDSEASLKWLAAGPAAQAAAKPAAKLLINLEPNYESAAAYQSRKPITDFQVRRAAWWSCLVTPTAGVAYGAQGVWWWSPADSDETPFGHPNAGTVTRWSKSLDLPAAAQMKHLADCFTSLPWHILQPAQDMLARQEPGIAAYIAAARSTDGKLAVLYAPASKSIELNIGPFTKAAWLNPRTGQIAPAEPKALMPTPGEGDWVLILR